jgi:putative toxin-antitoxin system antitoxin component (TIGR02293 family)
MLLDGIPGAAFLYLVDHLSTLQKSPSFERAVGMSLRTMQRRKDSPLKRLSPEQSGRTWKFAEILARTTRMLGSQEEAELWLARPQMGLDGRRPIDLMATPAGIQMLETFICRLEYGVYT